MADFDQQHAGNHRARNVALQQRLDGVVANAQRLRKNHAAQSDRHAADGGPPHPVDRQLHERVFGGVDAKCEERGEAACQQTG